MDSRTTYTLTLKGEAEIKNTTSLLNGDIKRALTLVDDRSTVTDLLKRAAPSLRMTLTGLLQELENGGFIQDKFKVSGGLRIATPKIVTPAKKVEDEGEELDFTVVMRAPTPEAMAAEAARAKAEAEARANQAELATRQRAAQDAAIRAQIEAAKARADAEARAHAEAEARVKQEAARAKAEIGAAKARMEAEARAKAEAEAKANQAAETARLKAEQEAARARAEAEAARAKADAEVKARAEAEARARQEAEAVRRKAEQEAARVRAEAEAARRKAEQEAARARAEAEAARLRAEQEAARVRAELEAAKARAEAEARARAESEARAKQEAEAARLKAEQEAARARAELDAANARAEAEARARAEAEARARQEAEAARLKAEQEAVRVRAELEAAKAKAEAEGRARAEAEARAKQETEAARLQAEQESVRVKAEFEAKARAETEAARRKAEQETVRVKAEFEARARAEAEAARIKVEKEAEAARRKAEKETDAARAQFEAARSRAEAEARAHAEAETRAKEAAEAARLKAEQEAARAKAELEAAKAREVAEAMARAEVEARARQEVEAARLKAEEDARRLWAGAGEKASKTETVVAAAEQPQLLQPQQPQPGGAPAIELAPIMLDLGGLAEAQKETGSMPPREEAGEEQPLIFKEFAVEQERGIEVLQTEIDAKKQKEIETGLRAEAERKARLEAEATRLKAEEEEARIKAEAAARSEAEEAERKMAAEQARVWAEAEQRAKSLAEAQALVQAESGAVPQAKPEGPAKIVALAPRKHRKPLPWGKMAGGLLVLLLVSVAVLPYFWPMQDYAAKIESGLSEQLRQKVHIGRMNAALLPLPRLELQDVSVGNSQELKAGKVALNFGLAALFSETKAISQAEVDNLAIGAESFDKTLGWLQAAAGDARYPVKHAVLQHVRIGGEGLGLPSLNGSADMDAQGHVARVVLSSEDGKFGVEIKPQPPRWQIALNIRENSLPLLPDIKFNELNAKGDAGAGSLNFSDMDGRLYGGMMMGGAKLSWQKGWQMQGRITVKTLELQKALPQFGVSGEMDGDASFTLTGEKLAQLTSAVGVDGSFVVKKGAINNMDIVETATSSRQSAAGGRTHFDELSGLLQADGSGQHLKQIRISAGVMSASGSVDISPGRQLSGRLNVDLKMRAGLGSVPLSLSGAAGKPVLRVAR